MDFIFCLQKSQIKEAIYQSLSEHEKIKFLKLLSASDMFCAKNENGNTAGVDMGGPLVVESGHRYELVGVTTGIRYIHRLVWPQQKPIQLGKISFIIFLILVD